MAVDPIRLTQAVQISSESCSALCNGRTSRNDPHGNAILGGEHNATYLIFVHPLYGPLQLHGGGPRTCPTGSVYILGSPVAPYSLGVRLGAILIAIHHLPLNTLLSTEFLFTHCTELYSSMAEIPVRLPEAVY